MHITDIDSKIPKEGEAVHANFHVTLAYAFALPILKISITAVVYIWTTILTALQFGRGGKTKRQAVCGLCGASLPLESEVLVHTVELLAA